MQKRLFCFYMLIVFFSASMQAFSFENEPNPNNDYQICSVWYRFNNECYSNGAWFFVDKDDERVLRELKNFEKSQESFDVETSITIKKKNGHQYSVVKTGFYGLYYFDDGSKGCLYDMFSSCKSQTVPVFFIDLCNNQKDKDNFGYPMNQTDAKIEEVTLKEPTGNSAASTIKLSEQPKQKFNNKTIFGIPLLGILGLVVYKLLNKNSSAGLSAS